MNVSDCIKMRRSIRKYKPDHIDHSIIDSIIAYFDNLGKRAAGRR